MSFKKCAGFSVIALLFCFVTPCHAMDITLAWDANTEPNLVGYRIYYDSDYSGESYDGTGAVEGESPIDVENVTEFTLHGLSNDDVYFFVVTAYNDEGLESGYSNEVSTQCSLTLNTVGSGNVGLDPAGGSYDVGTEVELEALSEPGWQFSGWSGDLTGSSNPATITMCSHKTVTATFARIQPVVNNFAVIPSTISKGEFVELVWSIAGADSATIDNGVGAVAPTSGSVQDAPMVTTKYTLTATNSAGSVTSSVMVIVAQGVPVVNSFTATPGTITNGEYVTLSWNISGATTASINNGVGAVSPSTGSVQVSPVGTTAYTLIATNDAGSISKTVTITVVQPSPVINSFTASPEQINEGESAILSWSISNADSAAIDNSIGSVDPLSDSLEVTPLSTTTYTLTATNGGSSVISTVTVMVSESLPPEIIETIPHNGAGISDGTRVSHKASFCVRMEDSDGIDITDPTSIRFTIDDGVNGEYTRDLNDLSVVRVVKLTEEDDTRVTELWVAYDRFKEDEFEGYDFDTLINIKVDIKDRTDQEMEQEVFSLKIETEAEHENAQATSPSTDLVDPSDPDLADPEYFYDTGIEVISGDLKGGKIIYNSSEPVIPIFGPIEEIPCLGADNEGTPMNLQPPTVFNTPVKVFIPYPGYSDVRDLSIFLHTGNRWVLACDADGNLEPGGDGWMVPGSRVNHNDGDPSTIEIKIYHFSAVLAHSGTAGTADTGSSNASCFINTVRHY